MLLLKKILFFFLLSMTLPFALKSQINTFPKHTIVLDAGGIGGYGSLNYERCFFSKKDFFISYRAGFSFYRFKDFERKINPDLLFPISIQGGLKYKSHHAILGFGQTISSLVQASRDFKSKIRNTSLSANFTIGYRFQKTGKPFSVQLSYTPLFEHYARFRNWGSLSFGYSFFAKNNRL
ncbi:MAG: hypothetical protein AB8H03_17175 [Saprospiraceae bacterium]